MPACIECDLWVRDHGDAPSRCPSHVFLDGDDVPPGRVLPDASKAESSRAWWPLGAGPSHSAFLSAFFTLVGTHGLHVSVGLIWLIVMLLQVATLGFQPMVTRRFYCFGLFWHALDIVWIGVFTIVYLGANSGHAG